MGAGLLMGLGKGIAAAGDQYFGTMNKLHFSEMDDARARIREEKLLELKERYAQQAEDRKITRQSEALGKLDQSLRGDAALPPANLPAVGLGDDPTQLQGAPSYLGQDFGSTDLPATAQARIRKPTSAAERLQALDNPEVLTALHAAGEPGTRLVARLEAEAKTEQAAAKQNQIAQVFTQLTAKGHDPRGAAALANFVGGGELKASDFPTEPDFVRIVRASGLSPAEQQKILQQYSQTRATRPEGGQVQVHIGGGTFQTNTDGNLVRAVVGPDGKTTVINTGVATDDPRGKALQGLIKSEIAGWPRVEGLAGKKPTEADLLSIASTIGRQSPELTPQDQVLRARALWIARARAARAAKAGARN